MADRIAILNVGGVLEQLASPAEILRAPANDFVARFVGTERTLKRLSLMRVGDLHLDGAAPDRDGDDGFARRSLRLDTHFQGAGKLDGSLTAECAAAVAAVLESLGKKAGPEDDRTAAQRRHDALEEACRRLIAAGCLPEVAGQAVQVQLHLTLDQLRKMPGGSVAE